MTGKTKCVMISCGDEYWEWWYSWKCIFSEKKHTIIIKLEISEWYVMTKKILERHIVSMNGVYDCWRFVYGNVYHKPVVWTHLYSLSGMIIKGGEDITCFNFIQIIIFYLWNIITKLTILINIIKLKVYIPVD